MAAGPNHRGAGLVLWVPEDDAVMLARRSPFVGNPGLWSIPGGHAEPDESSLETALREFLEEMGDPPDGSIERQGIPTGTGGRPWEHFTYVAVVQPQAADRWRPQMNWENTDWGWFDLDDLPEPMDARVLPVLDWLRRRGYET